MTCTQYTYYSQYIFCSVIEKKPKLFLCVNLELLKTCIPILFDSFNKYIRCGSHSLHGVISLPMKFYFAGIDTYKYVGERPATAFDALSSVFVLCRQNQRRSGMLQFSHDNNAQCEMQLSPGKFCSAVFLPS